PRHRAQRRFVAPLSPVCQNADRVWHNATEAFAREPSRAAGSHRMAPCASCRGVTMTVSNQDRLSAIQQLMATHQDRRTMLKAPAATELIPVHSSPNVAARAAAQDADPDEGGDFVTLGQAAIESLSPEDIGETVQLVPISNI